MVWSSQVLTANAVARQRYNYLTCFYHLTTVLNPFPEPFFLALIPGVADETKFTLPFLYTVPRGRQRLSRCGLGLNLARHA